MSATRRRRRSKNKNFSRSLTVHDPDLWRWDLQDLYGAVALADHSDLPLGRDVATLTYAAYVAGANWANPSGELARHTAGSTATIQQDDIIAAGKTWQYPVVMSNRTAGSVSITGGDVSVNSNGTTIVTITATGADVIITPSNDFDGDLDLAQGTVKQTDILGSRSYANPGDNPVDGANTGMSIGNVADGNLGYAYGGNGIDTFVNNYSVELNSFFNPAAGTLIAFAKVANAGVWTDNTARKIIKLTVDGSNKLEINKRGDNDLSVLYTGAGTTKQRIFTTTSLDYFQIAMTWSIAANEFIGYLNGVAQGAIQTFNAPLVGNFSSTATVIGAASTVPSIVWNGDITRVGIANRAFSAQEIANIWQRSGLS